MIGHWVITSFFLLLPQGGFAQESEFQVRLLSTIEMRNPDGGSSLVAMVELPDLVAYSLVSGPVFVAVDHAADEIGSQRGADAGLQGITDRWADSDSGSGSKSGQTLSTTIQDPDHPEEPWVVTTYRRPGESMQAFVGRHREMVASVRQALGG